MVNAADVSLQPAFPVVEWAAVAFAATAVLEGLEAALWPQWLDTPVGLIQEAIFVALAIGLALRLGELALLKTSVVALGSLWLELAALLLLISILNEFGKEVANMWRLDVELTEFQTGCMYFMLGVAADRLWRMRQSNLGSRN